MTRLSKRFTADLSTCSVPCQVYFVAKQTGLHLAALGFALTGLSVMGLAVGCQPQPLSPEETLQRFLADIRYGQAQSAFLALCMDTQVALRTRHERLASGTPVRGNIENQILFRELGLEVLHAPENINIASPIGDTVTLRVTVQGGDSANVYLKRERARWCVDLNKTLQPIPSSEAKPGRAASQNRSTPGPRSRVPGGTSAGAP